MKVLLTRLIFLAFLISLSGCTIKLVPNNTNYSRTRHVHNEYCGHTGEYYYNNERKNTNLHYYDKKTGKRKKYSRKQYIYEDNRYRDDNHTHKPKWLRKFEASVHRKLTGHDHRKNKKKKKKRRKKKKKTNDDNHHHWHWY